MRKLIALLPLLLSGPLFAACHAVSPSGSGSHSGADWNNEMAGLPATLVRGDIYYLADGTYASYTFNQSGTATVEIRKAQTYDNGSSCSPSIAAGWNGATMGNAQAVFATYRQLAINSPGLILNGNGTQAGPGCGGTVGSTPTSALSIPTDCGIKIDNSGCTGTSGNSCSDGISDGAVLSGGWTMEYIEILGVGNATSENYMIRADNSTGTSISHMYLHNFGSVCVVAGGTTNINFNLNYIWRNQIVAGSSPAHGQCFEVGVSSSGGTVSNNVFRDLGGTAAMATFLSSGTSSNWKFYNNTVWTTSGFTPLFPTTDGIVACINSHTCNTLNFSQNSIVNMGNNSSVENQVGGSATVQNNLWYTSGHTPSFGPSGTFTQDHNSFLVSGTSCASGTANVCDNASANPFTNWPSGNFTLASDAADWNNRASLGAPFTVDQAGNAFTTDRGAFQFINTSGVAVPTANPAAGTYTGAQYINLNDTTAGATICWRSDGTTPTATTAGTCDAGSNTYSGSVPILITTNTTILAIGTKAGLTNSSLASFSYVINNTTWYVSTSLGGPRYSPGGNPGVASCSGQGQTAFNSGGGPNQSCPFQVYLWLYNDPYIYNTEQWIIQGGDTVIVLDVGAATPNKAVGNTGNYGVDCWGIGPGCTGPPIPSGTASKHTVIRGVNGTSVAACQTTNSFGINIADPTKTSYLWSGGGSNHLFDLSTSQYVDIACIDERQHSSCNGINLSCSGTDWTSYGIWTGQAVPSTNGNITLTNMKIHGFQSRAIRGNVGGPWTVTNVEMFANGSAGWDFDPGGAQNSNNAVIDMENDIVWWNGCTEEFPDVDTIPIQVNSCTDDSSGGYGDGIGTTPDPGFISFKINHSLIALNTQDGSDLGHLFQGAVTYTNNLYFGNMGGAMKIGNATSIVEYNNFSEANCTRMAQAYPGVVSGYNSRLSDFCRAGGDQNTMNYDPVSFSHGLIADVEFNTFVGTGATVMDAQCFNGPCIAGSGGPGTYSFTFKNNAILGYANAIGGPTPPYPYNSGIAPGMWNNLFPTVQDHNLFTGLRSCPAVSGDLSPTCALDTKFTGEPAGPVTAESQLDAFNFYPSVTGSSPLIHAGVFNSAVPLDYYQVTRPNPPTVGAAEPTGGPTLTSITVTPNPGSVSAGSTLSMTCTAHYSDGSSGACVSPVWTDTNNHSSINASTGVVTGISAGSDTITATIGSISGNATVNVTAVTLSSIAVTPNPGTVFVGGTLSMTCTATYSDSSTGPCVAPVWTDTGAHSSINSSTGIVTGSSVGSDTITATIGSINGNATVNIVAAPPTAIQMNGTIVITGNGVVK